MVVREVAFPVGVDMIGQPVYMIHRITENKPKFGKATLQVTSLTSKI